MIKRFTFDAGEVRQILREHVEKMDQSHKGKDVAILVAFGVKDGQLVDAEVVVKPAERYYDPRD